ncbi:MAG: prephenate dehydrogenase/arogenate dehydrogenase family protein, partial [Candidatus Sulfotelmatobacter sp.]
MGNNLSGKKVAVLGAGKMGGILLQALLKNGLLAPELTTATVAHEERAREISTKLGIPVGTNNLQAARDADVILIAVKPQVVEEVMAELRGHVSPRQLVISVAASVPNSL